MPDTGQARVMTSEDGLVTFRRMTMRDLDEVLRIERASFTAPWSRNAFAGELMDNHFAEYLVMYSGPQMIGYGGMWVIVDEAHVTNIAVYPEYRGKKNGERLLRMMMAEASARGARRMTLEVRVSNEVAKRLYRKLGFVDAGVRKGYYTDNHEDALIMWAHVPPVQGVPDVLE